MSDSDMDIDDEDVQHTIAIAKPIKASNPQNDVESKIIEGSCGSFRNLKPNVNGKTVMSSFPGPEHKRASLPCRFFAQGRCVHGNSCRFVHVKENTSQQQMENHVAGTSGIQIVQGRRPLESKEGGRFSLLGENGVTSLVNPSGGQIVFPFRNEIPFMPSLQNTGRGSLQKCDPGNRPVFDNSITSFPLRSSFVQEHGSSISSYRQTDMGSSGPGWTGSLFSSVPMNQYVSNLGHFENKNDINGSGSPPVVQARSVSSVQDAQGDTTSNKKKVSSDDWEPSEPFQASFTIPPYILPSSDALYDPFTDIENPEDESLNAPSSSKRKDAQKKASQQKDSDSASGPQVRDCNNDDKNSSCSQNQYQETVARKNMEAVEGVATSVVDQNDATTPSKEVSSSAAAENRIALKRSRPAGHRSNGSSHQKALKSDEIEGEVRSDTETKAMRQFRTAVVETIKDMLKPLWREGRLTKDVHNMIVKGATGKIVNAAVQSHQLPTNTTSLEHYLSMSAPKIVKLLEGYVEKYGKPKL